MLLHFKKYFSKKVVEMIGGQRVMTLQVDITNACNLSCAHCYHSNHSNKGAISLEEWFQIIEEYKSLIEKLYLEPKIVFCGGEPTISPFLVPILERLNSCWPNVRISILTNGTRLTNDLIDRLSAFNIEMQVSLDGPDASRHDQVRGKGSFLKAISGLQLASSKGIDVFILAILSKKTSLWIDDFFKMAKKLKIRQMNFTRFISQGAGFELESSGKDRSLRPLELKDAMEQILATSKRYRVRTNTNQSLYNLIDPKLGANEKYGFQGMIIDYKGNLKVSSRADYIVGNVLDEGLSNLFFNNPILKNLRKAKIETCGQCAHYRLCGGNRNASYVSTGSFFES